MLMLHWFDRLGFDSHPRRASGAVRRIARNRRIPVSCHVELLEDRCLLSAVVGASTDELQPIESHGEAGHDDGPPTIAAGQSQTVIGPHHAEPGHAGTQTHFFAETGDAHHFAWQDQNLSTPNVIDIYYDFRDLGGKRGDNLITPGQIAMAELALERWEAATGGQIQFSQNTSAPASDIINIGTGNLRALGRFRSGPGGILGLGGGTYTHNSDHTITSGIAWMDFRDTWDEVNGNGDQSGTFDYFTVVAQEVGHALGLGHVDDLPGTNIMNGSYTGEVAEYSTNDEAHIQAVYGVASPVAGITVSPTAGLVTSESGGTDTFMVVLNTAPTADVTIGISSSDTLEGTVDVTSLTFTAGNWNTPQMVTVTGVDDVLVDGDVAYTVITAAAVSTDSDYNGLNANDVSVTNTDNEVPAAATTVSVESITYRTYGGRRGNKNLAVTVALLDNLDGQPGGASVSITLTNTTRGLSWSGTGTTGSDGTVTFTLRRAPTGAYTTDVDDVTADSLTWDGLTPTNGFTKSSARFGRVVVGTPADSAEAIPVPFVVQTTAQPIFVTGSSRPANFDPATAQAESHYVLPAVATPLDSSAGEIDSDDLFSGDSDVENTIDTELTRVLPQSLDAAFNELLAIELDLL